MIIILVSYLNRLATVTVKKSSRICERNPPMRPAGMMPTHITMVMMPWKESICDIEGRLHDYHVEKVSTNNHKILPRSLKIQVREP